MNTGSWALESGLGSVILWIIKMPAAGECLLGLEQEEYFLGFIGFGMI